MTTNKKRNHETVMSEDNRREVQQYSRKLQEHNPCNKVEDTINKIKQLINIQDRNLIEI